MNDWSRAAWLSDCGLYRYTLARVRARDLFDPSVPRTVGFIMLNPSKADALEDDPTVRRCIGYAELWGFSAVLIGNLFALRSTDPAGLFDVDDPVGPENDRAIAAVLAGSERIVCAWGKLEHAWRPRAREVLGMLRAGYKPIECLGTTKSGDPKHPVRLAADAPRVALP